MTADLTVTGELTEGAHTQPSGARAHIGVRGVPDQNLYQ